MKHVFTIDNLLHSLVALAVVTAGIWLSDIWLDGGTFWWVFPILVAIGLYLREASQADWDFGLNGSLHKHLEWAIGSVVGFAGAIFWKVILF
jgi:hypothetical protein